MNEFNLRNYSNVSSFAVDGLPKVIQILFPKLAFGEISKNMRNDYSSGLNGKEPSIDIFRFDLKINRYFKNCLHSGVGFIRDMKMSVFVLKDSSGEEIYFSNGSWESSLGYLVGVSNHNFHC